MDPLPDGAIGRLGSLRLSHQAAAFFTAFMDEEYGGHLVTGGDDASLRVWAREDGRELRRIDVDGPVRGGVLLPGGKQALVTTINLNALLVDLEAGTILASFPDVGFGLTGSADGRFFVAAKADPEVGYFELRRGEDGIVLEPSGSFTAAYNVTASAFSPTAGESSAWRRTAPSPCAAGGAARIRPAPCTSGIPPPARLSTPSNRRMRGSVLRASPSTVPRS